MPVPAISTDSLNSEYQLLNEPSRLLSAETVTNDSAAIAEAVAIPKNLEIEWKERTSDLLCLVFSTIFEGVMMIVSLDVL